MVRRRRAWSSAAQKAEVWAWRCSDETDSMPPRHVCHHGDAPVFRTVGGYR
jgi:hypothetical protein